MHRALTSAAALLPGPGPTLGVWALPAKGFLGQPGKPRGDQQALSHQEDVHGCAGGVLLFTAPPQAPREARSGPQQGEGSQVSLLPPAAILSQQGHCLPSEMRKGPGVRVPGGRVSRSHGRADRDLQHHLMAILMSPLFAGYVQWVRLLLRTRPATSGQPHDIREGRCCSHPHSRDEKTEDSSWIRVRGRGCAVSDPGLSNSKPVL